MTREKPIRKFLLVVDGPMGSGKTTVSAILHKKLKRTAHIGLDKVKWFISDFKRVATDNEIVQSVVSAMTEEYLHQGINVILEQGMRDERVKKLRKLAKKSGARFLGYQLDAPKKLLFTRVKQRPVVPGKPKISDARIERNYRAYLKNKPSGLIVLDVEKMTAQQVANRILRALRA
jgi:predicted kinase